MPELSRRIDPLVTPYRRRRARRPPTRRASRSICARVPPCHSRVAAERAVRELDAAREPALCQRSAPRRAAHAHAPAAHRRRAEAAVSRDVAARPGASWRAAPGAARARRRARRRSSAARSSIRSTDQSDARAGRRADRRSREVLRDEQRCSARTQRRGASRARWPARSAGRCTCPTIPQRAGLELVGSRPCLYGEGASRTSCTAITASRCRCSCCRTPRGPNAGRGARPRGADLVARRPHVRAGRARAARRSRADGRRSFRRRCGEAG